MDCQHEHHSKGEICIHLFHGKTDEFFRHFTGVAKEYNLICPKCRHLLDKFQLDMKSVCPTCFDQIETDGDFFNYIGEPATQPELKTYQCEYHDVEVPALRYQYVVAMQAIPTTAGCQWLIFDGMGQLHVLDLDTNSIILLNQIDNGLVDRVGDVHMVVSPAADYAALISRSRLTKDEQDWNHGIIIDLITGEITMRLNRGDYHTAISEFPVAFFQTDGVTRIVHATAWNRLDISDPATGECLTQRDFEQRPAEAWRFNHAMRSEFSGRLSVSPNQRWLVDDGWEWGPNGCLVAFDVQRWANHNVWEADNGPSKSKLAKKEFFWGAPSCWINDETLCVWGQGTADNNMIPAAVLYDMYSGKQIDWFPGPARGLFVFDEYLYTTDNDGHLSGWDVKTGKRVIFENDFNPQLYHPIDRSFLYYKGAGKFVTGRIKQALYF